eukprot:SAG11_NODE_2208_length_3685_cov_1.936419_4_plen_41_part_00
MALRGIAVNRCYNYYYYQVPGYQILVISKAMRLIMLVVRA